jgi:phosphoadenosine phosphosulfate reductase
MPKVIMVKKLLASGEPCAKCTRAEELLKSRGVWEQIDEVVWAKEGDPTSAGALLARKHEVELAPFFIIQEEGQPDRVFTSTLQLVNEVKAARAAAPTLSGSMTAVEVAEKPPAPSLLGAPTPDAAEVREASERLADRPPGEILGWALERFGADCALAFSGAEDVVLLDMAARSGLPFSVFCLDTGRLHEQTYRFIDRVRAFYAVDIQIMLPQAEPLQAFVRKKGLFSFMEDGHGECCGLRKVEPLGRALKQFRAWATGQRRDQSPATRGEVKVLELDANFTGAGGPLIKVNPLSFWTSAQVWAYIREQRVPYNELHDHGFISIGCQPCTRPLRPGEHERAARWWWEEATQRECGLHVKKTF